MESALLFAQLLATGFITLWLTVGLLDNIRHPSINETFTAEVLSMERMREAYPDLYAQISLRAIHDRRTQRLMFRLVVCAEALAVILLWIGTLALLAALAGLTDASAARPLALLGTLAFTSIWSGFLIVGNYFGYWLCHDGAQNTHFQMTLWGIGTMILLAQ